MFAAIYVPDFPVETIMRAEPELRERAVAVVEGTPPLVRVVAVNERAAQAGVEPGMTKLEAEERLASGQWPVASDQKNRQSTIDNRKWREEQTKNALGCERAPTRQGTVRQRSADREAVAHAALLDCACGFSPRVEDTATDTVVLDVAGLERIFGPPAELARDLARRYLEMGLEANVAVASNADTAVLAARGFAGVTVIPEGAEAQRLGELSVEILVARDWSNALPIADCRLSIDSGRNRQLEIDNQKWVESLDTLERWGVRNLRALAALPEVALAERLGQEGLRLQKLARGDVRRALVIAEPPLVFEESAELEYPVETLEPLAFFLNHMLEQLCARLAARALATNELSLRLSLEVTPDCQTAEARNCGIENETNSNSAIQQFGNSAIHERTLRLPVPMLDAKVFLKLMQLDLQAHPPQAAVTKVWLRAGPAEPRRMQNGLFVPEAPEAEKLELTIARIKRVVSGQRAVDGGQENRQSTIENQPCSSDARVGSAEILDQHRPDAFRMKPFAAATGSLASDPGTRVKDPCHILAALRVFRPALAAVVSIREGRPAQVASPERPTMRGEVVWCAGPWRSSGEWWTEQAWSRQEWDVAVRNEEGVALYRIYRDEIEAKWWVEGSYD